MRLSRVHKTYLTGTVPVRAIDGIDLQVRRGEFVVIMGPSGCGKSTLLNLIGAVDTPTSGTIEIDGTNLASLSDDELTDFRRCHVGFVFQFYNLIPSLTAAENIGLPLEFNGEAPPAVRKRVAQLLALVHLQDRADHTPSLLSGGEQQRVAIARALANDPDLVLMDEPTGDLDSATTTELLEALRDLNEQGVTMVVVTHDPIVARFAHRTITLRDGQIVAVDTNGDRRSGKD